VSRPKSALRARYLKWHALLVYVFLFLPIVILIVFSFNHARSGTDWTGFSTRWYHQLIHDPDVLRAFRATLKVAFIATAAATVIGTLGAFALARFHFFGRAGYSTLVFISLVMPEVVMGISMLAFFKRELHWQTNLNTVILAHIAFCIPFVVVVVRARLAQFDDRLIDAASDLGATPTQSFLRIVLPLAAPGIAAGAMLAFTISLDDLVITHFTTGPGGTTLPNYIFGELHFGVSPAINALSTIVLLFSLLLLTLAGILSVRSSRRGAGGIDATAIA
jgi:spermidine/putrescine transport system permease protein